MKGRNSISPILPILSGNSKLSNMSNLNKSILITSTPLPMPYEEIPEDIELHQMTFSAKKKSGKSETRKKAVKEKIDENEGDDDDDEDQRNIAFCCLCKCLNPKNSHLRFCCDCYCKLFCGCPIYMWIINLVIYVATVGILVWLAISFVKTDTTNKSYFAVCKTNSDCNVSVGLHCATENSGCNCPAQVIAGHCDCNRGKYWNGTKCIGVLTLNQKTCVYDYQCDTSKGLTCENGTCDCQKPKIWNSTIGACNYIYVGCFFDGRANTQIKTTRTTISTFNFLQICVERCKALGNKFALTSSSGTNLNCNCNDLTPNGPTNNCDIPCVGLEELPLTYFCGSSRNNGNVRNAYNISVV